MIKSSIEIRNIGRVEYSETLAMQHAVFDAILSYKSVNISHGEPATQQQHGSEQSAKQPTSQYDSGEQSTQPTTELPHQTLFFVEHPHVYTLGKSGNHSNLLIDDNFLQKIGATYFKTDRGGDVTYHGTGQLVGYPILDLEVLNMSLKEYIHTIEECVIDTVAEYGISASRMDGATGVWIEEGTIRARKICAIGVKASRYVTMHGFALNVTTDLSYFSHINPCGFTDKGVTSIENETGLKPSLDEVATIFTKHFEHRFASATD